MSDFEKWFLSNGIPLDTDFNVAKRAFEAGQQSQQAKIDELNEKHSEEKRILHNVIDMNQTKIDELQGRIDEAMDYIAESGGVNLTSEMALNHILKGNKDER